jgi:hypothetical protein
MAEELSGTTVATLAADGVDRVGLRAAGAS